MTGRSRIPAIVARVLTPIAVAAHHTVLISGKRIDQGHELEAAGARNLNGPAAPELHGAAVGRAIDDVDQPGDIVLNPVGPHRRDGSSAHDRAGRVVDVDSGGDHLRLPVSHEAGGWLSVAGQDDFSALLSGGDEITETPTGVLNSDVYAGHSRNLKVIGDLRQPLEGANSTVGRSVSQVAAVAGFLACAVAANAVTAQYGLIPVGFGLMATAGTYLAGLVLVVRDLVHDLAGRMAVLASVAAGAALSSLLAGPRLAVASGAAFAVSELADLAVYQPLRRRGWAQAVIASNLAGSVVDTLLFLSLAGFPIWVALPGQLVGKTAATLAVVIPVVVGRAVFRHTVRA